MKTLRLPLLVSRRIGSVHALVFLVTFVVVVISNMTVAGLA